MTAVFAILAAVLVWTSLGSVRGGIRFFRFFERSLDRGPSRFTPFASVIVPCRGVDQGLEENLQAFFDQDYPEHEVLFVTGGEDDGCVPVIRKFLGRPNARLIFAGAAAGESQKVANLRAASAAVSPQTEVLVFADSDARPGRRWLAGLVGELDRDGIGASTGYRWFLAESPGFASELRACWNASVASRLGEDVSRNFCWGGSCAILRSTFERLDVVGAWRGALSDDYALMRTVRAAGLGIAFVPAAMAATVEDCSMREVVEFTNRQMKITRVYAPALWLSGLVGAALFNMVLLWGLGLLILSDGWGRWAAAVSLSAVWGLSVGKAYIRLRAVGLSLPGHREALRRQTLPQTVLWVLAPALFLINCLAALFSREVVWRGIRYRMVSPGVTETPDVR